MVINKNGFGLVIIFILFILSNSSPAFSDISLINFEILKDEVKNFHKVSNGIYRSSQPDKETVELMEVIGIKTILNLRKYHSDEKKAVNTDIKLESIKMDAGKISDEEVITALQVLKYSEKPILIHCWHGSDRTGVIVAMYRIIFENYTREDAIKELRDEKYGYHEGVFPNVVKYIKNVNIEKIKEAVENKE